MDRAHSCTLCAPTLSPPTKHTARRMIGRDFQHLRTVWLLTINFCTANRGGGLVSTCEEVTAVVKVCQHVASYRSLSSTHLHPVAHLHKCTGRVEGSSSTGIQVSAVVVVHNLHVIHTVGLKHKQKTQM